MVRFNIHGEINEEQVQEMLNLLPWELVACMEDHLASEPLQIEYSNDYTRDNARALEEFCRRNNLAYSVYWRDTEGETVGDIEWFAPCGDQVVSLGVRSAMDGVPIIAAAHELQSVANPLELFEAPDAFTWHANGFSIAIDN